MPEIQADEFYTASQRAVQDDQQTRDLADRLTMAIFSDEIPEEQIPFIESRDFFFLSTVNERGEPTVSYKGGPVGIVKVLDPKTFVFPCYDGNGMFLSMGNIGDTGKIGLLFIDFETPNRFRVQATATVSSDDPEMASFPGASMIVRGTVDTTFVNCARMIHKHERVETSPYVPDENGEQPYPAWKRIDAVQDVLRPDDQGRAEAEGGIITMDDYAEKLMAGES
ncbi:MAG: pyridoxamine 5'-phosphate oxidase family protein [Actinomycetota bacterium]